MNFIVRMRKQFHRTLTSVYSVAMAEVGESGLSAEAEDLSTASLWKGENDSDAEQMEAYDSNPLASVFSCFV